MTRPTARELRRTAGDMSGQVTPHLSHARDVMVDTVIPKARETMVDTVIPRAREAKDVMVDTVIPKAKDTMVDTVLPRAKATGVGLAVRAGLAEAPKKRHPFRKAALLAAVAAGAYAAWNAWRLPAATEDWSDPAAGKVPTDERTGAAVPGVPAAGTSPSAV